MPPKLATFDPLDAPLWEGYELYQSMGNSVRADSYQHLFWVDPKHWQRHKPPEWVFRLKWRAYQYSTIDTVAKLRAVAKRNVPGIYIFSVRPDRRVRGFPCYALYVGISNATGTRRPLWRRLAKYLPRRISAIRKRRNIHRMTCLYFPFLWVHFAYVDRPSNILIEVEKKLHGYLAPPVADAAYPVDMKPHKPAF